jgi:hypothetical protein
LVVAIDDDVTKTLRLFRHDDVLNEDWINYLRERERHVWKVIAAHFRQIKMQMLDFFTVIETRLSRSTDTVQTRLEHRC